MFHFLCLFFEKDSNKNLISTAQSPTKLPVQPASPACNYLHIYHEKRTLSDNRAARGQDANWVRICSNGGKHSSYTLRQWVLTSNCIGLLMASRGPSSHKNHQGLLGFKLYWHGHTSYGCRHTQKCWLRGRQVGKEVMRIVAELRFK